MPFSQWRQSVNQTDRRHTYRLDSRSRLGLWLNGSDKSSLLCVVRTHIRTTNSEKSKYEERIRERQGHSEQAIGENQRQNVLEAWSADLGKQRKSTQNIEHGTSWTLRCLERLFRFVPLNVAPTVTGLLPRARSRVPWISKAWILCDLKIYSLQLA